MAWYSGTFASTVSLEEVATKREARELLSTPDKPERTVFSYSRNGVLLGTLGKILACSSVEGDLYLLNDQAVLVGREIWRQHSLIASLLADVERDPQFVLVATRERYEPSGTVHAAGFQPLPYEMAYSSASRVKDGWVYYYTKDAVRSLAASARCGPDPKPEGDDEGESLEYVFGFLKSHASLLQSAISLGLGVAYAEMNYK